MDTRRVNMKLIASIVGVDVSTVSRALNGSRRVKVETREAILTIARELNYRPNELARGLVTRKTNTIGIIVPEISNSFYAGVLMAIEKVLTAEGYSMILGLSHYETRAEKHYLDLFLSKKVDGLIFFSSIFLHLDKYSDLAETVPAVLVDFKDTTQNVDLIASDNIYGVKLVLDYLVSLGHRNIAFITDNVTTGDRLRAFKLYTKEYGLNCSDYIVHSEIKYEEGGYKSIEKLLSTGLIPTAVFCANDYMALGALKAIVENGLSVPEDISVVGFDDSTLLGFLIRSITTVRQPKYLLGEQAAKLLIRRIKENDGTGFFVPREKVVIKPELIIRDSTGPCKN